MLGSLELQAGRAAEAEPLLRESVSIRAGGLRPDHPDLIHAECELGVCLTKLRRFEEAARLFERTLARAPADAGPARAVLARAREEYARLYDAWGKPDDARRIRDGE
jgi:tetratricopeptide (TPR) repeat protein